MKKRSESNHTDEFRQALVDVTPLAPRNKARLQKPRPRPVARPTADIQSAADDLSDHVNFEREPGQALSFSRPGVQRQVLRDLRRGSSVEDELDLHGLTVAQARPLLIEFLNASRQRQLRYVRIIHGKGMRSQTGEGVLKARVASWLSQRHDVLAFREARAEQGGSGAVNVLLKGMRDEG
jgi:DNA-nicking Smr family endonuclease